MAKAFLHKGNNMVEFNYVLSEDQLKIKELEHEIGELQAQIRELDTYSHDLKFENQKLEEALDYYTKGKT